MLVGGRPARGLRLTRLVAVRPGRRALPADRRGPARRRDRAARAAATPSCSAPSAIPRSPPGVLEKGILLRLRFDFHQYINLRPDPALPGRRGPDPGQGARRHRHGRRPREQRRPVRRRRGIHCARERPRKWRSRPRSTPARASSARSASPSTWPAAAARPGPFRGLSAADRRPGLRAAGHAGGQDQRPDLRPRPLDACLHRSCRATTPRSRATISMWTPAACGW